MRHRSGMHGGSIGLLVTLLSAVLIAIATLRPDTAHQDAALIRCIMCGEHPLADAVVNAILFAPLGVGFALMRFDVRRSLLLGALTAGVVEALQLAIPGRDASVGDVLFDSLGTGVGFAVAVLLPYIAGLDARRSRYLALVAAFAVAAWVGATGWLFAPSFPHSAYWGRWTPNMGPGQWYRGRVREARIAGRETRSRAIDDSEDAREALLRGGPIDVAATAGPPADVVASLFSVEDEQGREIVFLGPYREDLVFRYRTNAVAIGLEQPPIGLEHGWRDVTPGTSVRVRAGPLSRGLWCLTGPSRHACGLGYTIGSGWGVLYYPDAIPNWLRTVLDAIWAAIIVAPVGFLLRRGWQTGVAVGIVAASLTALPRYVHLRATPPVQLGSALLGLTVGLLTARILRDKSPHQRGRVGLP